MPTVIQFSSANKELLGCSVYFKVNWRGTLSTLVRCRSDEMFLLSKSLQSKIILNLTLICPKPNSNWKNKSSTETCLLTSRHIASSVLRRLWALHGQTRRGCLISSVSGILTDGIQGQSPAHFSLPTSQINTSLVFSAACTRQHQVYMTQQPFPLANQLSCQSCPQNKAGLPLCTPLLQLIFHTNTYLPLLPLLYACSFLLLKRRVILVSQRGKLGLSWQLWLPNLAKLTRQGW